MISYEELCEALDKHNSRRRNQAELDQLEGREGAKAGDQRSEKPVSRGVQVGGAAAGAATAGATPGQRRFSEQPGEDTHEIEMDDMMEEH